MKIVRGVVCYTSRSIAFLFGGDRLEAFRFDQAVQFGQRAEGVIEPLHLRRQAFVKLLEDHVVLIGRLVVASGDGASQRGDQVVEFDLEIERVLRAAVADLVDVLFHLAEARGEPGLILAANPSLERRLTKAGGTRVSPSDGAFGRYSKV